MTKSQPLHDHLAACPAAHVPMTFDEIERILGEPLPQSAAQHRAWWSNNDSNNVMTRAWLSAGFRTEQVDMASKRLVFRRDPDRRPSGPANSSGSAPGGPAPAGPASLFCRLKGTIRYSADLDLTAPADASWAAR